MTDEDRCARCNYTRANHALATPAHVFREAPELTLREQWEAFHAGTGEQPIRKHVRISHDGEGRRSVFVCGVRLYGVTKATLELGGHPATFGKLTVEILAHELDVEAEAETALVVNRVQSLTSTTPNEQEQ